MRQLAFQTPGIVLILAACLAGATGCQDLQHASEIARLADQLKQSDSRLAVATTQVEVASSQINDLKQSLEQSKAETNRIVESFALERVRLEKEKADIAAEAGRIRAELLTLNGKLADLEQAKPLAEPEQNPIGVWAVEANGHPNQYEASVKVLYRFAFYEDGDVVGRQYIGDKWSDYDISPMMFTRTSPNSFRIEEKTQRKSVEPSKYRGDFIMESGSTGKLRVGFLPDDFGKARWYPASLLGPNIQPPEKAE